MNNTTKFKLKDPNSEVETSIRLVLYSDKMRFIYGTGYSIAPDLWSTITMRPKIYNSTHEKYVAANANHKADQETLKSNLDKLHKHVGDFITDNRYNPENQTFQNLRNYLDSITGKEEKEVIPTFLDYAQLVITRLKDGKITTAKGKKYAKDSINGYLSFVKHFAAFEKKKRKKYKFEDITLSLYHELMDYFNSQGLMVNTIGKNIKHLKAIMARAKDENLHMSDAYKHKKFVKVQESVKEIYLNEKEIYTLYSTKLEGVLEKARILFLVGCYTGLRISDYMRIRPRHIKKRGGMYYIEIDTRKNSDEAVIPVGVEIVEHTKGVGV